MAIIMTSMGVGRAVSFGPDVQQAKAAAKHIFDLLDRTPRIEIGHGDDKYPVCIYVVCAV